MTREQILETAREILYKNSCDPEIGCSCCNPAVEDMFEYLDGAIGEILLESNHAHTDWPTG